MLTESPQFLLTGAKRFTWKDFFWKVFRITVKKYFMFFILCTVITTGLAYLAAG